MSTGQQAIWMVGVLTLFKRWTKLSNEHLQGKMTHFRYVPHIEIKTLKRQASVDRSLGLTLNCRRCLKNNGTFWLLLKTLVTKMSRMLVRPIELPPFFSFFFFIKVAIHSHPTPQKKKKKHVKFLCGIAHEILPAYNYLKLRVICWWILLMYK